MPQAAIPWITLALTAAGGAYQYHAQRQAGKYEQDVAEQNAQIARQGAADARARGQEEAGQQRMKTRRFIGAQKAAIAASGIDPTTGSALDTLSESAAFGELDALTIQNNASREAWGYQTQATGFLNEGRLARSRGRQRGYATLLTTAGETSLGAYKIRTGSY
jgi:hypothetical protein